MYRIASKDACGVGCDTKNYHVVNGLVFISDCHKSIAKSIAQVFLDNFHALCIHHMSLNLTTKFNNNNMCANFMLRVCVSALLEQVGSIPESSKVSDQSRVVE